MIKLSNNYELPNLGLGTFLMNDDAETKRVILEAIEIGYRHFDTAQMYLNEHAIGDALLASGLKRSEFFITTKLNRHHSKAKTRELIYKSFADLKVDYIDLLLIHWPNHDDKINIQTWEVFEEFYEKGLVKAIGLSNFTRYQMEQLIPHVKIKPHVNQVEMHPGLSQVNLIKYLNDHGIQLMGYGPLMRGNLFNEPYFSVLDKIAKKYKASIAQIAIAWGLAKNVIMIPKSVNKERLEENFNASKIILKEEDIKLIDKLNTGRRMYADPANNVYGNFIE